MVSPVTVYVPYVRGMLHAEVIEALEKDAPKYVAIEPVEVDQPHDATSTITRLMLGVLKDVDIEGEGYHRLIERVWQLQETFIVVEQDNVVGPNTIDELLHCEHLWCGATYAISEHPDEIAYHVMLGCTKFDARLMAEYPWFMDRVSEFGCERYRSAPFTHVNCKGYPGGSEHDGCVPRTWVRLDTRIQSVMSELHIVGHVHDPIGHVHDYSHKAGCKCQRCLAVVVAPMLTDPTAHPLAGLIAACLLDVE